MMTARVRAAFLVNKTKNKTKNRLVTCSKKGNYNCSQGSFSDDFTEQLFSSGNSLTSIRCSHSSSIERDTEYSGIFVYFSAFT